MSTVNWNVLFFIWLGAFVFINLLAAGFIISQGKRKKPVPDCAGALIVTGFIGASLCTYFFSEAFALPFFVSGGELAALLTTVFILMLLGYLLPLSRTGKIIMTTAVIVGIVSSFVFLNAAAFISYSLPFVLLCFLCGAGWLWLIRSFSVMNKVDGLTISEGSLIGISFLFFCFLNHNIPLGLGILGTTFAVCLLGFRSWNTFPAKLALSRAAVIPVAFIAGWLLMKCASLGFWTAALIIPLYFLMETGFAAFKKLIPPLRPFALPYALSAMEGGFIPNRLVKFIFFRNLILMAAALISTGTSVSLSFLILSAILTVYELYQLKNWNVKDPTIKEITSGLFHTVKQGLREQKQLYSSFLQKKTEAAKAPQPTAPSTKAAPKPVAKAKASPSKKKKIGKKAEKKSVKTPRSGSNKKK